MAWTELVFPPPALFSDWVGVRRRLVQKTNIGLGDMTFLARLLSRSLRSNYVVHLDLLCSLIAVLVSLHGD